MNWSKNRRKLIIYCKFHCIAEARYKAMEHGVIKKQREPFSVRDKGFWDVVDARKLLEPRFAQSLCHEPDGLIFQPSLDVSVQFLYDARL